MDFQSLNQYEGKAVKITLINSFWYRAKILKVSETAVEFVECGKQYNLQKIIKIEQGTFEDKINEGLYHIDNKMFEIYGLAVNDFEKINSENLAKWMVDLSKLIKEVEEE